MVTSALRRAAFVIGATLGIGILSAACGSSQPYYPATRTQTTTVGSGQCLLGGSACTANADCCSGMCVNAVCNRP
jgi:hypothetical protein